jgi:hypothetical protein
MFQVEIERADGQTVKSKPIESRDDAYARAEEIWLRMSGDGETIRVSAVDSVGNRLLDFEF